MFDFLKNKKNIEELESLEDVIRAKKNVLEDLNAMINQTRDSYNELKASYNNLRNKTNGMIEIADSGYEFGEDSTSMPSYELEAKIVADEEKMEAMIGDNSAIVFTREYKIDGSIVKGRKFQENFVKTLLTGFNTYVAVKTKSITQANMRTTSDAVVKCFERYSKKADIVGMKFNIEYLDLAVRTMRNKAWLKERKKTEKAKIREEKRRLKEQEQLIEEIEQTKRELAKEKAQYEKALGKAMSEEEVQKIKTELEAIAKREEDCDYRLTHSRAGWLYVIDNKALPGMCKIGCTRRLDPTVRVQELSSASLPFPFVIHGLVFSEDVFALEATIHAYYNDKRVNVMNTHKEFFYVLPEEAIEVLKNEYNCEVISYNNFEENT